MTFKNKKLFFLAFFVIILTVKQSKVVGSPVNLSWSDESEEFDPLAMKSSEVSEQTTESNESELSDATLPSNGVNIDCEFNTFNWGFGTPTLSYCKVKNCEVLADNRVTIATVNGKSVNHDIQAFWVHNCADLKYFPSNLNNVFPKLELIDINHSQLDEITSNDLLELPNLKYFFIQNSNVKELSNDVFSNNPNLEIIYMPDNKLLNQIEPTTFDNLEKLKALVLNDIACGSLGWWESRHNGDDNKVIEKIQNGECMMSSPTPAMILPDEESFFENSQTHVTQKSVQNDATTTTENPQPSTELSTEDSEPSYHPSKEQQEFNLLLQKYSKCSEDNKNLKEKLMEKDQEIQLLRDSNFMRNI